MKLGFKPGSAFVSGVSYESSNLKVLKASKPETVVTIDRPKLDSEALPTFSHNIFHLGTCGLGAESGFGRKSIYGFCAGLALTLSGCSTTGGNMPTKLSSGLVEDYPIVNELSVETKGTPAATVQGALFLISQHQENYKEDSSWFNLDPNHPLPANVELKGMEGKSKCNLFAQQAIYLGGFEPARYGNQATGEYANANQIWKWGSAAIEQFGNPERFKTIAEAPLNDLSRKERLQAIIDVLKQAAPGDLLLVDHGPKENGETVVNRGHARVVLKNHYPSGQNLIEVGHATDFYGAVVERERPEELLSEHHIWILRPSAPIEDPAVIHPEQLPKEQKPIDV